MAAQRRLGLALVMAPGCMRDAWVRLLAVPEERELTLVADDKRQYARQCHRAPPTDITIIHMDRQPQEGLELVAWIRDNHEGVRPVVLLEWANEALLMKSLHAGACGHVHHTDDAATLQRVLQHVAASGHYHTDRSLALLHAHPDGLTQDERLLGRVHRELNGPRLEVLILLYKLPHATNARIAKEMSLATRTVEWYITDLLKLFDVKNRTELVKAALRLGLVGKP